MDGRSFHNETSLNDLSTVGRSVSEYLFTTTSSFNVDHLYPFNIVICFQLSELYIRNFIYVVSLYSRHCDPYHIYVLGY
jgi:hypothetical protein